MCINLYVQQTPEKGLEDITLVLGQIVGRYKYNHQAEELSPSSSVWELEQTWK